MRQFIIQTGHEGRGYEDVSFRLCTPEVQMGPDVKTMVDLINSLEVGGRVIVRRGDDIPNTGTVGTWRKHHNDPSWKVQLAMYGAALVAGIIVGAAILYIITGLTP